MTDDFDDILRSRLQQSESTGTTDAHSVLGQLQPAMRRARIRRTMAIGTATLSLLGVSVVGLAAVTNELRGDPSDVNILREIDTLPEPAAQTSTTEPTDREETTDDPVDEEQRATPTTTLLASTTTAAETTVPPTTDLPTATTRGGAMPSATTAVPVVQPTTPPPTPNTDPPVQPATTTPATTSPPTTTPTPSGQRTIPSNCGSIGVSYSGSSITLTSTKPAAGFAPDVKKSGPGEVEVGFSDGDDECEIKAWVESGELRTDIDNHEGDEDGDDDDNGDEDPEEDED